MQFDKSQSVTMQFIRNRHKTENMEKPLISIIRTSIVYTLFVTSYPLKQELLLPKSIIDIRRWFKKKKEKRFPRAIDSFVHFVKK